VAYNMTPAPSFRHQRIVGNFFHILRNRLSDKGCITGIAPTDVFLSEYDVVQPDIFVVCDEKKITEANIQGAPDLIIEVLSQATAVKDRREKKAIYEKYEVKEYIIIDPNEEYIERFCLEKEGTYDKGNVWGSKEVLPLHSLEGIEIPLWEVFEIEGP
ncbi:MAG: Uma2 family endonuclease, partial [Nitrospinae bacterium]|nr:Uma2 family endonuclease [Nitrospinota bacterium]